MSRAWTVASLFELTNAYQPACVLMAAAELDLFSPLAAGPQDAAALARAMRADPRGTAVLADALAALGLLDKHDGRYAAAPGTLETLTESGTQGILPMLRHRANCMRSWARLAETVRRGGPVEETPSVRGEAADLEAFIDAMAVGNREAAPRVVAALELPPFRHLLDVGGGPGTWTAAFLARVPEARATLLDRPEVLPIARRHLAAAGLAGRVTLVGGDYLAATELPGGVDVAWLSAIVHQDARAALRTLYAKVFRALVPGGLLLIRDIVMDEARTAPVAGALFAVNMLVRTAGGGTWSEAEFRADLEAAGFRDVRVTRGARDMDAIVRAVKP